METTNKKQSELLYEQWNEMEKELIKFCEEKDVVGKTIKNSFQKHTYWHRKVYYVIEFTDESILFLEDGEITIPYRLCEGAYFECDNSSRSGVKDELEFLMECNLITEDQVSPILNIVKQYYEVLHQENISTEIQQKMKEIENLKQQLK